MDSKLFMGMVFAIVLLIATIGGCNVYITYGSQETVTITVTEKERITTGSGEDISSKYLVFTDGETFENTDTLLYGKFDSSDLQGKLKVGHTYTVKVYWYRIPFLSSYRNVIEIVEG